MIRKRGSDVCMSVILLMCNTRKKTVKKYNNKQTLLYSVGVVRQRESTICSAG